jgi:anti-sigma factor RsiW
MTRSDEHAEIRGQLARYVAGALEADAEASIAQHIATCPSCAAEFERWQLIGSGLRRLPTPQPSPVLFERTQAMAVARMAARAEQRQNTIVLVPLILFSWAVTIAGWPVFRFATGGFLSLLDIQFRQMWILFGVFTALAWLAGGCAAVMLSARRQQERRFA